MTQSNRPAVAHYSSETEALIVVGLLQAAGLDARLVKDDAGGAYPMLQPQTGVLVTVPLEDVADAEAILAESDPSEMWRPQERGD